MTNDLLNPLASIPEIAQVVMTEHVLTDESKKCLKSISNTAGIVFAKLKGSIDVSQIL